MKFKYTRTIQVEVETELPFLGYDIPKAIKEIHDRNLNESLRIGIGDGRDSQTIQLGGIDYKVTITDNLQKG
jgi:hypothetical protein